MPRRQSLTRPAEPPENWPNGSPRSSHPLATCPSTRPAGGCSTPDEGTTGEHIVTRWKRAATPTRWAPGSDQRSTARPSGESTRPRPGGGMIAGEAAAMDRCSVSEQACRTKSSGDTLLGRGYLGDVARGPARAVAPMRWSLVGASRGASPVRGRVRRPGRQNETWTLRGASGVPNLASVRPDLVYPAGARSDRSPALLESRGRPWHRLRTR
jgi:hypothetical protein